MNQTIAKRSPVAGRIPGVNPKSSKFGRGPGSRVKQNASMSAALVEQVAYRNKRSVWTFATQPHKGTHYATFPEELVRICLLAGCPLGGVVLDPFAGSGTVGVVASRFQRDAILIELDQRELVSARRRIEKHGPLLVEFI